MGRLDDKVALFTDDLSKRDGKFGDYRTANDNEQSGDKK
jgi:hypothetical protein